MSLVMTLAGFKKALTFRVGFNAAGSLVGVEMRPSARTSGFEYIHLWACYQAKVAKDLGYPHHPSAMLAIRSVCKVVEEDLGTGTDCLDRAGFGDVITYASGLPDRDSPLVGTMYAKGRLDRRVKTRIPGRVTERQKIYSALALMQYAVGQNICDSDALEVLARTAKNLVSLFSTTIGTSPGSVVRVPRLAYMHAIELTR